jgi:hypothetical protein
VRDHLEALDGAIQIEQLPAYTPELNPPQSAAFGDMRAHTAMLPRLPERASTAAGPGTDGAATRTKGDPT